MEFLLGLVNFAFFIVWLVCFIMVLVKMFQNEQTVLAIVAIVLTPCAGIGILIAFIVGWINAGKWKIQNFMMIWTAIIVISLILSVLAVTMGVFAAFQAAPELQPNLDPAMPFDGNNF